MQCRAGRKQEGRRIFPSRARRVAGKFDRRVQPRAACLPRGAARRCTQLDAARDARHKPAPRSAIPGHVHRAQTGRSAGRDLVYDATSQSISGLARSESGCVAGLRMMTNDHTTPLPVASTAGAQLRAAREAAGWSQEAVAQQLKLAPRQVRAIEEDDYARLPGRTFVRGFVRNYARLVRLDPSAVIAALPRGDGTAPLDRRALTAVSRPMVELPVASVGRNSWTRWLIPVALLAIVAAAGVYEFMRTSAATRRPAVENDSVAPSPPPESASPSTTALPNPLAKAKTESAAPMEKSDSAATVTPPVAAATSAAPANTATATAESTAPTAASPTPNAAAPSATLLLTFKEKSWVEVKDGNGAAIFVQTGTAGTTQTLSGTPPLDVSIGNAAGVMLTYRGQPIDIAPYTRANVARLLLK